MSDTVNGRTVIEVITRGEPPAPPTKTPLCGCCYRVEYQNSVGEWKSHNHYWVNIETYESARSFALACLEYYPHKTYRILSEPML